MPALLLTKLYIPPIRPGHISRPRLLARLTQGLACPFTLLSAPPGFGKTSLLSEWISTGKYKVGWLSLDAGDNNPFAFWAYFMAALQTAQARCGEDALAILQSPQPPPIETILTALINDLASVPDPLMMVLDDYHVIEAPPIHAALAFLLDHLPPTLRLVLAGRADPPLPLARWRARGQLAELRAADLRFTLDEAAALFRQAGNAPLSAEEVATLEDRTEGWVAGLQLAALSLQGLEHPGDFVRTFSGSQRHILDYLMGEVLTRQPPALQTFLLQTSILERLTGALCNAVTGRADGQAMLEQLEQANLFIVPLDGDRRWYRYHHLFADLLRHRAQQALAGQPPELHRRAADWYAEQGFITEAIHHALQAGQPERAAAWVEENAIALLARGELFTLHGWLEALPAELRRSRPWLGIQAAWFLQLTGQAQAAEARLREAEQKIDPAQPGPEVQDQLGQIAALRAYALLQQGDRAGAEGQARRALEFLPESNGVVRSLVGFALGSARLLSDDVAGAAQALAEANTLALAGGNLHLAFNTSRMLASFLAEQGNLNQALALCQEALQKLVRGSGSPSPVAASLYGYLGALWYEKNELSAAERHLTQAIELGEKWGNLDTLANNLARLAWLRHVQQDDAGARAALERAGQLLYQHQTTPGTPELVQYVQVRVWLAQGQLSAAERWASQAGVKPDGEIRFLTELQPRALAHMLMAQGKFAEALGLCARLRQWAEAHSLAGKLIALQVLEALILRADGQLGPALDALGKALSLAEPGGYVRTFVDEGESLRSLFVDLRRQIEKRGSTVGTGGLFDYVDMLLAAFPATTTDLSSQSKTQNLKSELVEPLTDREIELLHMIAHGLSNQEIAQKLVITVGTVKAHTSHIYRKLDVRTRTQAVARARDLNLL